MAILARRGHFISQTLTTHVLRHWLSFFLSNDEKKEREANRKQKVEAWVYNLHSTFWHYNTWETYELRDIAEGSWACTSKDLSSHAWQLQQIEAPRCANRISYSWGGQGEKGHASITSGHYTMEVMPRWPPARGTLPRAGAGGMDHWQTGRKHGCPALGRPLRRWNKTEHHWYGEQCISEATSSKELDQARSNCRVSLITASLPASLPFSHLFKKGGII